LTSPPDQPHHALGAAPPNFHQLRDTTVELVADPLEQGFVDRRSLRPQDCLNAVVNLKAELAPLPRFCDVHSRRIRSAKRVVPGIRPAGQHRVETSDVCQCCPERDHQVVVCADADCMQEREPIAGSVLTFQHLKLLQGMPLRQRSGWIEPFHARGPRTVVRVDRFF
jgi:hypothetical protein